MTFVLSHRSVAAFKPIALASALATLSLPAVAQVETGQQLAPVMVSQSRFESDASASPIGATVITAEQIREAGVGNVNEAIRKIGGVYGRQNLTGTSDFSLDLRGFGTNSDQNIVVLIDGIRLSEAELQPAVMSGIPIESIERIEIVRGGSGVLYGDGATGGTIQIISKQPTKITTSGSVVAEVGNRGYQNLRASLNKKWNAFSIDANLDTLRTDNYRKNNKLEQDNFSGGFQWSSSEGRIGLRVNSSRQHFGLAGSLTLAQFQQDPRQTATPLDYGSLDSDRLTLFGERNFGNFQLAAELSHRNKTSKGHSESAFGAFDSTAKSAVTQFSPRFKYLGSFGGIDNELVMGIDLLNTKRDTVSTFGGLPSGDASGEQKSIGVYARDEMKFERLRISAGIRHERFEQRFSDPLGFSFTSYDRSFSLNAWDLQGSYQLSEPLALFAKAGKSYRVANIDEYSFSPNNQLLNPQRSNDLEFGATLTDKGRKFTARIFRHDLTDEIFYDPTIPNVNASSGFGANANLDPTKRQGIEIEANGNVGGDFNLSAMFQHVSAKFREGQNAGKKVVLVPQNIATLRLNWLPGNGQSADVGVQWVDKQRYGDDFSNTCSSRMPSYAIFDARYSIRLGEWEFAVSGTNLGDKDYYSLAFRCNAGIYPDAGRALKLSARKSF